MRVPTNWPRCRVCHKPLVILKRQMSLVCLASTEHCNDTGRIEEVQKLANRKPSMVILQKTAAELVRDWNQA